MLNWQDTPIEEMELEATIKTDISIVPSFNEQELHLWTGSVGPITAGSPVAVPLWLAFLLKQKGKCRIIHPSWMTAQDLNDLLQTQKKEAQLIALPHEYFFEISYLFIKKACDDLEQLSKIKCKLEDLENMRAEKIKKYVAQLAEPQKLANESAAGKLRIRNMSVYEVGLRKTSYVKLMADYHKIIPPASIKH